MFAPARYLQEHADPAYAELCRRAIAEGAGTQVEFPSVPNARGVPEPGLAEREGE